MRYVVTNNKTKSKDVYEWYYEALAAVLKLVMQYTKDSYAIVNYGCGKVYLNDDANNIDINPILWIDMANSNGNCVTISLDK